MDDGWPALWRFAMQSRGFLDPDSSCDDRAAGTAAHIAVAPVTQLGTLCMPVSQGVSGCEPRPSTDLCLYILFFNIDEHESSGSL